FARLVTDWTVDRMVKEQKLHCIPNRLMNALRVGTNFHVVRDRRSARGNQLWSALGLDEAHPATAFYADIGVVAGTRNLDSAIVRQLNDRLSLFGLVYLSIESDLRHKLLD